MIMNNQLQKAGGISAIVAATMYLFAMGLVVSVLQPVAGTNLKNTLDTITMGIDHSDKLLGCLWIGLASAAAIKRNVFPKIINIFGLIISILAPIGIIIPTLNSISYAFGVGIIVWLLVIGIFMSCKNI
jgi:hypothetical protein